MSEETLFQIEILKKSRGALLERLQETPRDAWGIIPEGFKTNLIWNLGHLLSTQQALHYFLSGVPLCIDKDLFSLFRKGSDPTSWEKPPSPDPVLEGLLSTPDRLLEDYRAGRFVRYRKFTTSLGNEITTIEEAVAFNNFHEGLHTGIIQSITRLLK